MANDPAFLFYPGDYLRDTQCLSEPVQVAYDRIMCEHMRNICISQQQLNFFTKRLKLEEKEELLSVITETDDGFQITWVAESICKRRSYSESRRENRVGKTKKDMKNTSLSYVEHMENENENTNDNIIENTTGKKAGKKKRVKFTPPTHEQIKEYFLKAVGDTTQPNHWPEDKCHNRAYDMLNHYEANGWVQKAGKPIVNWEAACRTWIRNVQKGTFEPLPPSKGQQKISQPVPAEKPKMLEKIQDELNYCYGMYLEGGLTVISLDVAHYHYLKGKCGVNFSEETVRRIERHAMGHCEEKGIGWDDQTKLKFMKLFGVIEFFTQAKTDGKTELFSL